MNESIRDCRDLNLPDPECRAWGAGTQLADDVIERYGTSDPLEIASTAGLEIQVDEWGGMENLIILGTYSEGVVTLYRQQIDAYARDHDVDTDYFQEAVLVHELAHHFISEEPIAGSTSADDLSLFQNIMLLLRPQRSKPIRESTANGLTLALLAKHQPHSPVLDKPELLAGLAGDTL